MIRTEPGLCNNFAHGWCDLLGLAPSAGRPISWRNGTKYRKGHQWGEVSIIGVDLAKNVIQVQGSTADRSVLVRKRRPHFAGWMSVAIEAADHMKIHKYNK